MKKNTYILICNFSIFMPKYLQTLNLKSFFDKTWSFGIVWKGRKSWWLLHYYKLESKLFPFDFGLRSSSHPQFGKFGKGHLDETTLQLRTHIHTTVKVSENFRDYFYYLLQWCRSRLSFLLPKCHWSKWGEIRTNFSSSWHKYEGHVQKWSTF